VTVAISSYTPVMRRFELSGGTSFATRGDGRGSAAHAGFRITRRQPEFRPVVEHADITNYNPEADRAAATQRTIDMTIGSTQYNKFSFDIDDARVIEFSDSDEDGLTLVEPVYRIFTPSSGQELKIKFL